MSDERPLPTIRDLQAVAEELIKQGFGDLPVQIVVAPDSTLQILARRGDQLKPALMIEYQPAPARLPVCLISSARLGSTAAAMPSLKVN